MTTKEHRRASILAGYMRMAEENDCELARAILQRRIEQLRIEFGLERAAAIVSEAALRVKAKSQMVTDDA